MVIRFRRGAPAFLATVVAALLLGTFSFVPTADAAPTMTVQLGFGGRHRPGADLLVQVEILADQLIDGELRISSNNGPEGVDVVLPVEIAGGARKRFVAAIPTVLQWQGGTSITLLDGSTVLASQQAQFLVEIEDELVGVLPGLGEDAPASASLAVELGDARIFAIDATLLGVGPGTIDALGTIVATTADLAALDGPARVSLRAWVETGGTLVVDDATGPIPGFDIVPDIEPQPLGLGRVMTTDGRLGGGTWNGVLLPTAYVQDPSGSGSLTGELTGEVNWFGGPVANSLAADAGFGLPPMRVVLPLMAGYVLLIGPIAWFVLRRMGRSGLLWVALPGIALAFTALIWAGGDRIRSGADDAHGTVIRIENGVAHARTLILESGAGGSTVSLEIPADWRPLQNADFQFGFDQTSAVVIRPGLDTTRVEGSLDAGDFVLLGATGPVPEFDDAVEVIAESAVSGVTTGTVTNRLDVALEQVAVFVGAQSTAVGRIEPGDTIEFEVSGSEADPRFGRPADLEIWSDSRNTGFGFESASDGAGPVNLSLWSAFMNANTGRVRQPGIATVVGWTDSLPSPTDPAVDLGRTAVLARAPIEPTDSALSDVAGPRILLRGAEQAGFDQNQFRFTVTSAWRFDVPSGVDDAALALQLPDNLARVEVWDGEFWRVAEDPDAGFYALPPGTLSPGAVYVKPVVDFDRQGLLGRDFALVTPGSDDEVLDTLVTADGVAEEES